MRGARPIEMRGLLLALLLLPAVACAGDEPAPVLEGSLADCGSSLDDLLTLDGAEPGYDSGYEEALAAWSEPAQFCGLGVFTGQCADGKRLLYRNGGFVSEIRYYAGDRLVGYVSSGDVGFCPSVCPFSHYYGRLEDVRCEAPRFEDLCEGSSLLLESGQVQLPFADGQAPGGCEP